jgi:hypothetical protein
MPNRIKDEPSKGAPFLPQIVAIVGKHPTMADVSWSNTQTSWSKALRIHVVATTSATVLTWNSNMKMCRSI